MMILGSGGRRLRGRGRGSGGSSRRFRAAVYNVDGKSGDVGPDLSVAALGMTIAKAPDSASNGEVPVMLGSPRYDDRYLCIRQLSVSTISVFTGLEGAGAYWFFEPRLPEKLWAQLLNYAGLSCLFDCGEVLLESEVSATIGGAVSIRLLAVIALVLATLS